MVWWNTVGGSLYDDGASCYTGVVCDKGLTLRDLIGTLKMFFDRLGLKKLRFKPAYNPYTEPSMEIFRCSSAAPSFPFTSFCHVRSNMSLSWVAALSGKDIYKCLSA